MIAVAEKKKQEERWIRISEAATHFGVSPSRIYDAVQQGARKKKDAVDRRVTLISLGDLQRIFERE